jgi:hypothetical protein
MRNFCSGTCAQRNSSFPPCSSTIHTRWLRHVCEENTVLSTRPSTIQYYWLRYVCEQCGAGPVACKYSDPAHQSPPRPSTMQYYWLRYVCEQCGAGPVACNYSDPAHHSPPRPSTKQYYWLRYVHLGSGRTLRKREGGGRLEISYHASSLPGAVGPVPTRSGGEDAFGAAAA